MITRAQHEILRKALGLTGKRGERPTRNNYRPAPSGEDAADVAALLEMGLLIPGMAFDSARRPGVRQCYVSNVGIRVARAEYGDVADFARRGS